MKRSRPKVKEFVRRLLSEELARLRAQPYENLVRLVEEIGAGQATDEEGTVYYFGRHAMWDDRRRGHLIVFVDVSWDDRTARHPINAGFLISPQGILDEDFWSIPESEEQEKI